MSEDFNVVRTLWTQINEICCPPPPPGEDPKAFFLMESPGFSVDPTAYDRHKFDSATMMSPDCAVASLCDRIPALASFFYDTGNHISYFWKIFLETFTIKGSSKEKNAEVKARYDEAIKMLYGSPEGYVKQEKTQLYQGLEKLRKKWDDAKKSQDDFKLEMQKDKERWPGNYETNAAPYVDAVEEAYTEYNNLKLQIERYEASIFAYAMGDLNTVLLDQANKMAQLRREDAGNTAATFYKVTMEPANWFTWFKTAGDSESGKEKKETTDSDEKQKEGDEEEEEEEEEEEDEGGEKSGLCAHDKIKDDDSGWTQVNIEQKSLSTNKEDTFSKLSTEFEASYSALFVSASVKGGFSSNNEKSSLTEKGKGLKISFKVRKVTIQRPWLDPIVLCYPTLGMKGMEAGAWSSGDLNKSNKGQFPLLPTAMVVAKDVEISWETVDKTFEKTLKETSSNASAKASYYGFSAGGNFSHSSGSKNSKSQYDESKKSLKIEGAQIIGWVCTVVPHFPTIDAKNDY